MFIILPHPSENVHRAIKRVKQVVGEKKRTIANNLVKLIARLSARKDVALDQNHENAVTCFVQGDVRVQDKRTV